MALNMLLIIPLALAILPSLLVLVFTSKMKPRLLLTAIMGGGGWFIALIARMPILALVSRGFQGNYVIVAVASSILAGVFEEPTRYFLLKHVLRGRENLDINALVSFGLGWGLTEALIIYVFQAAYVGLALNIDWVKLVPGALERNMATLFHVALTFIAAYVIIKGLKLIVVPISLHALANLYAVFLLQVTRNPWFIEGFLALALIPASIALIVLSRKTITSSPTSP